MAINTGIKVSSPSPRASLASGHSISKHSADPDNDDDNDVVV